MPLSKVSRSDPTSWSDHVVRALSGRLPGGIGSVTTPCDKCKSVFYPCLCSLAGERKQNLRAPRIVEVSELERLGAEIRNRGHLDLVLQGLDDAAIDKGTLEVVQSKEVVPADPARIVYRYGCNYVVQWEAESPVLQEVSVTPEQLQELSARWSPDFLLVRDSKHRRSPHQHSEKPELEWDQREVEYGSHDEAAADLELRIFECGGETHYVVDEVFVNGRAAKAGICKGHELYQVWLSDSHSTEQNENIPVEWTLVSEKMIPPVFLNSEAPSPGSSPPGSPLRSPSVLSRSSTSRMAMAKSMSLRPNSVRARTHWPCRLVFNCLPRGWRARQYALGGKEESLKPLTTALLQEIKARSPAEAGEVRIEFELLRQQIINRGDAKVRHQHMAERDVEWSDEADHELLLVWGAEVNLAPSQLEFTFRQVIKALSKEMQAVQARRLTHWKLVLEKCRRCVNLEQKLQRDSGLAFQSSKEEADRELDRTLALIPRHHLEEIYKTCSQTPEDEGAGAAEQTAAGSPVQMMRRLRAAGDKAKEELVTAMAQEKIRKHIQKERLNKKEHAHAEADGRMSCKEFRSVLSIAGITWLSEEETGRMFQVLDTENTGYVNLGQVMKAASRMRVLAQEIREFYASSIQNGETLSPKALLEKFAKMRCGKAKIVQAAPSSRIADALQRSRSQERFTEKTLRPSNR